MMNLTDKVILLASCLVVYLLDPVSGMEIVPVLTAVIISSLMFYYDSKRSSLLLASVFIAACLPMPGLLFFLPLVGYDLFFRPWQKLGLAALVPIFIYWERSDIMMVMLVLLLGFAVILKRRTDAQLKLLASFYELRDSSREMALILKRQNQELMEKQDDRVSLATLNERNRIAREIHDNVGHLLSSSLLQMGAMLAVTKDEKARQPLLTLKATLSEAMDSIRQSVHNLYDESVDLYAQLQALTDKFTFCTLEFDYEIQSNPETRLKYAMISIVKEALSNIVRHSDATLASVTLREHPAFYQLVVRDNGQVKSINTDSGIGLKNIESRVEAFQGIMRIHTKDGFALFISIPKGQPAL
ncbi:MAG: two-component sensor histidine kinase [Paenibacillaceae bacterium]|nr:two-component sensor histidine kinase [Paenibacillaceae bacterium]